jgi:hypothetical protein
MRLISRVMTAAVLGAAVVASATAPAHSRAVADTHGCCPLPPSAAVADGPFQCPFCGPVSEPVRFPANHNGCC